ncbi:DUF397 domain-containing protein [Streptomyces sp. NPDC004959]|uniref:DUF397 domain-containing protein n=1 Tax=unclassified Streptomyces TaxID=2593676 RepID=UPI0004CB79AF|nr:DUF397 domain-containing protein [Streptomyces sp. NRRL F-5630]
MNEPGRAVPGVQWRTSSYSNGTGNCVEVGHGRSSSVSLRDSKVADGPVVVVSRAAFAELTGTFGRS